MSMQELTSMNKLPELSITNEKGQYTLWQILGESGWLLALPCGCWAGWHIQL
jgi:hypothetical protein